jgi:hypothetical protein
MIIAIRLSSSKFAGVLDIASNALPISIGTAAANAALPIAPMNMTKSEFSRPDFCKPFHQVFFQFDFAGKMEIQPAQYTTPNY